MNLENQYLEKLRKMVSAFESEILSWLEIKENLEKIRAKQVKQLIRIYNKHKHLTNDPFKWGDEVEFSLIKFDHENKKCHLLLKSKKILEQIKRLGKTECHSDQFEFHPEASNYMVEALPGEEYFFLILLSVTEILLVY